MTTLLIDPAPGGDLRQRLYDGNLVILTRLRALADFVDYTRGELTELFKPHDPEHVHGHIAPTEMATTSAPPSAARRFSAAVWSRRCSKPRPRVSMRPSRRA